MFVPIVVITVIVLVTVIVVVVVARVTLLFRVVCIRLAKVASQMLEAWVVWIHDATTVAFV
jgi:hypothetical protein